jgi:hypothetical protein
VATGRHTGSSAVLATPRRSMSWWLVAFYPAAEGVAAEGVCRPGGASAQLAFVVSCMATAAPRCRTPGLACSTESLNSLLEVLCAVTDGDRLHWRLLPATRFNNSQI